MNLLNNQSTWQEPLFPSGRIQKYFNQKFRLKRVLLKYMIRFQFYTNRISWDEVQLRCCVSLVNYDAKSTANICHGSCILWIKYAKNNLQTPNLLIKMPWTNFAFANLRKSHRSSSFSVRLLVDTSKFQEFASISELREIIRHTLTAPYSHGNHSQFAANKCEILKSHCFQVNAPLSCTYLRPPTHMPWNRDDKKGFRFVSIGS